jgi:hypothetical protein
MPGLAENLGREALIEVAGIGDVVNPEFAEDDGPSSACYSG